MKGEFMCDFKTGQKVITPSGRWATVKRILSGCSKKDGFERVICQYEGMKNGNENLVTLQPHLLKKVCDHQMKLLEIVRHDKSLTVEKLAEQMNMDVESTILLVKEMRNDGHEIRLWTAEI